MTTLNWQETTPGVEEYCALRVAAGLSPKSAAAAEKGLPGSLYAICVRDSSGRLVGMGRVIGDGGCNFEIVDIAVAPDHQGQGLGKGIMQRVEHYLDGVVETGSYVCLIADKPGFYEKLGYQQTGPASLGMYKLY
ncbi:GNAT family N-acetyltransferase [Saccharospirillum mangrovi]|uniref:GNAT family N-acetyltransferase n=1 Tax=Saccharospirillum mangrovi TaxID=2161747 RepID=UPI000D33BF3F|nr:GNAT family N-acetyltransferase [Saccharospirillum mangrovi]